jgi:hypothetical protein
MCKGVTDTILHLIGDILLPLDAPGEYPRTQIPMFCPKNPIQCIKHQAQISEVVYKNGV